MFLLEIVHFFTDLKCTSSSCRVDDIEGIESLRWEDQQQIRKYVEGNGLPSDTGAASPASVPLAQGVEVSQTSRATCKHCSQKIMKGEVLVFSNCLHTFSSLITWLFLRCSVFQPSGNKFLLLSLIHI